MDKIKEIKNEIERRISSFECLSKQDLLPRELAETNVALQQYKELLQFINSLPEEPVNEDFVDREWQTECVIEILKFLGIETTHANLCDVGDILQKYVTENNK